MEYNPLYEDNVKISRIEIIEELLTKKNIRNAFLLLILYFVFGFVFVAFLTDYLYFFFSIGTSFIFISVIVILAYLFFIVGLYFESILFYTFMNPQATIKDAISVLSKLGGKWFITPFLLFYSGIHCWNLYTENYGLNVFIPFTKPNVSVTEWRSQTSSMIFTVMAMKGCDVKSATDDLFQLQKKYSDFLFKKGILYRYLLPLFFVGLLFISIISGTYTSSFILDMLKIPFNSSLYNLVFSLGFVIVPFFIVIFLWIFFYGARELIYVKLYSNDHQSQTPQPQNQENVTYQQI